MIRTRRADRVAVSILSASAGFIDAVGFLMLAGLFPAHVTGELVGLTTELTAGHHMSHPSRYAVIPVFILALFAAAIVTRSRRRRGRSTQRLLLGLVAASLTIYALSGFWGPLHPAPGQTWVLGLRECSIVAAMAFQNAFAREGLASACPTTVMTGNLTQLAFELVDNIAARFRLGRASLPPPSRGASARLWLVASAFGSFLAGAIVGGFLTCAVGAFSIVLPIVASLLIARRIAPNT